MFTGCLRERPCLFAFNFRAETTFQRLPRLQKSGFGHRQVSFTFLDHDLEGEVKLKSAASAGSLEFARERLVPRCPSAGLSSGRS